jgi:hypothetical protein
VSRSVSFPRWSAHPSPARGSRQPNQLSRAMPTTGMPSPWVVQSRIEGARSKRPRLAPPCLAPGAILLREREQPPGFPRRGGARRSYALRGGTPPAGDADYLRRIGRIPLQRGTSVRALFNTPSGSGRYTLTSLPIWRWAMPGLLGSQRNRIRLLNSVAQPDYILGEGE